jgi:hypothetical protein
MKEIVAADALLVAHCTISTNVFCSCLNYQH